MKVWMLVNEHGERLVLEGAFLIYRSEVAARNDIRRAQRCSFERTTTIVPVKIALRPWNQVWALVNEYGNLIADPMLPSVSPLAIYSVDRRARHVRNWVHRTDYSMTLTIVKMMMEGSRIETRAALRMERKIAERNAEAVKRETRLLLAVAGLIAAGIAILSFMIRSGG